MTKTSKLRVDVVSSRQQWRDFYALRRTVYKDDHVVVFPLKKMERMQLDERRNPFFEHARREAFLCYRDDRPVGRIVGIKDDLHNQHCGDQVGFFGFFEVLDDQVVADLLIKTVSSWLREQGCNRIRGPVNPSMKSEFGVVVAGNEFSPTIMLAHTPMRYDRHLIDAGLSVVKKFYAFHFSWLRRLHEVESKWKKLNEAGDRILKRFPNLHLTPVNKNNFREVLRDINALGNVVRSEGWGFVPLTEAELEFMINNLRPVIRYEMIQVAYWDDRLIGYIVNIPDVNWALKRTFGRWDWLRMLQLPWLIRKATRTRVIALGVDDEFRTKGVAMLLIKQLIDQYDQYDEWEFSWVDEDNLKLIRAIARVLTLKRYKTFQLYEAEI